MMTIKAEVKFSKIHGMGLFATSAIPKGTVVWVFDPHRDTRVELDAAEEKDLHHGYINPARPDEVVLCGDVARWWNFAHAANCGEMFPPTAEVESPIFALRDIAAGEELTITTSSDLDADRKLKH